jgi:hypothetical protein
MFASITQELGRCSNDNWRKIAKALSLPPAAVHFGAVASGNGYFSLNLFQQLGPPLRYRRQSPQAGQFNCDVMQAFATHFFPPRSIAGDF